MTVAIHHTVERSARPPIAPPPVAIDDTRTMNGPVRARPEPHDSDAARAHGGRILALDDEPDVCELLRRSLEGLGFQVDTVADANQAHEHLDAHEYDALLVDLRLGPDDGLEVCRAALQRHPDVPTVVVTGHGSLDAAVGAIRAGAYDFVTKPVDMEVLGCILRRAVSHRRLGAEVERLRAQLQTRADGAPALKGILGDSPALKHVLDLLPRVANSDATVLITGASGTGKELIARALHDAGARREAPMVAINVATLPAPLLESELFGHVRGAFTDAKEARRGLFLEAGRGTLFLDEIGELPIELQPKLLRALQERTVRPVGSSQEFPVEARVIAATNRDLEQDVRDGRFREDLFYRINVIRIAVPPLAARGSDVLLLAQHQLAEIAARSNKPVLGFTPEAAAKLLDYDWPGNVRELHNAMERALALARYDKIRVADLPEQIRNHRARHVALPQTTEHMPTLSQLEQRYVESVLTSTGGNKAQAARILGLDRRTLYRKLDRFARQQESS
jgi:DNA-binding NtrC family response regulator